MSDKPNPERRTSDSLTLSLMKHFDDKFDEMKADIIKLIDDKFNEAFVDGDPRGHKEAHQKQVDTAKTWSEIWTDVKKKVITGAAWGLVVGVFTAVGTGVSLFIKKYFGGGGA